MGKFCPEVKIGYAVRGEKGKKLRAVVSKADLPSNVIYYKFCFSLVSKGQRVTDHMLFGTPGTLLDWILRHKVIDSKKIKMFVLDEADVMIALQGHQDQSIRIHKSVNYCFRVRSIIWQQIFVGVYFQELPLLCASQEKNFCKIWNSKFTSGNKFSCLDNSSSVWYFMIRICK